MRMRSQSIWLFIWLPLDGVQGMGGRKWEGGGRREKMGSEKGEIREGERDKGGRGEMREGEKGEREGG